MSKTIGIRKMVDAWRVVFWSYRSNARVDPSAFHPDEYPVICLQCGYELRGADTGRCSECGMEYDRGNLLVRLYIRGQEAKPVLAPRWGWRCNLIANVLFFGPMLLLGLITWVTSSLTQAQQSMVEGWIAPMDLIIGVGRFVMYSAIASICLYFVSMILMLRSPAIKRIKPGAEVRKWVREHRPWEK